MQLRPNFRYVARGGCSSWRSVEMYRDKPPDRLPARPQLSRPRRKRRHGHLDGSTTRAAVDVGVPVTTQRPVRLRCVKRPRPRGCPHFRNPFSHVAIPLKVEVLNPPRSVPGVVGRLRQRRVLGSRSVGGSGDAFACRTRSHEDVVGAESGFGLAGGHAGAGLVDGVPHQRVFPIPRRHRRVHRKGRGAEDRDCDDAEHRSRMNFKPRSRTHRVNGEGSMTQRDLGTDTIEPSSVQLKLCGAERFRRAQCEHRRRLHAIDTPRCWTGRRGTVLGRERVARDLGRPSGTDESLSDGS